MINEPIVIYKISNHNKFLKYVLRITYYLLSRDFIIGIIIPNPKVY